MYVRYLSSRSETVLGIVGAALILLASILPMFTITGSEVHARSEWWIIGTFAPYVLGEPLVWIILILFALPLLAALFILGTSGAELARVPQQGLLTWRKRVAVAGLLVQLLFDALIYLLLSFSQSVSIDTGFVLTLIGFFLVLMRTNGSGVSKKANFGVIGVALVLLGSFFPVFNSEVLGVYVQNEWVIALVLRSWLSILFALTLLSTLAFVALRRGLGSTSGSG